MDVGELIRQHRDQLTRAERRVADGVLADPEAVAFGTVADLAQRTGTSGATVLRLAARLGLDGFSDLQRQVQRELGRRLRPATERIRQPAPDDLLGRARLVELDNVQATLDAVDPERFEAAVAVLTRSGGRLGVAAGDAATGIAGHVATELSMLRPGVVHVHGDPVAVERILAPFAPDDALVVVDLRRYDAWLVEAVRRAAGRGVSVVALSDSALSPLAAVATHHFEVQAGSGGPFDSYVGVLALLGALVAAVAARRRGAATRVIDRVEAAWMQADALLDP